MTHATYLRINEPCDPERLFGAMRQVLNIPAETKLATEDAFGFAPPARMIRSSVCVANAALSLTVVPGGVTLCGGAHGCLSYGDQHWRADENTQTPNIEECHHTGQRFYAEIMLDTAYSGGRALGCLLCFHLNCYRQMLELLVQHGEEAYWPARLSWYDEYHGEWHEGDPPRLCPAHHPGAER